MGGQVGGFSLSAVPGAAFVGLLLLGALLSTIVIVQRSRVRVLDVTEQTYDDVGTGLALLERRVTGLAAVLTVRPLPEAASEDVSTTPDLTPTANSSDGSQAAGPFGVAPAAGLGDAMPAAEPPVMVSPAPGSGVEPAAGPPDLLSTGAPGEGTDRGLAELALADARERLEAAATLRASSASLPVSRRCRQLLLEGLAAVHFGYEAAGRDPGPVPPPPTAAPLVDRPVRVRVGDAEHVALPAYAPGYRCCYSGGVFDVAEIPGGWYADAFWEELLAAGAPPEG